MTHTKYNTGELLNMSRTYVQSHPKALVLTSEGGYIYATSATITGVTPVPVTSSWAKNRAIYDITTTKDSWSHIHVIWNVDTELDTLTTLMEIKTN